MRGPPAGSPVTLPPAGTIAGFILADTLGIFGFKLPHLTGLADTVLVIEIVVILLLAITGWAMRRSG